MAGDWMKVEKDTPEKPEIYRIAEILGISQGDAFLACFRVWRWADSQTADGVIRASIAAIDDNAKHQNFHHALCEVGWLKPRSGSVELPNFVRHMGLSAKRRCLDSVRKMSARKADKTRTREEKRREESKHPQTPSEGDLFDLFWQSFPKGRKQGKEKARKAFAAASKKMPPETIIAAAKEYAASPVGQGAYVKAPESWLNGGCWEDDRAAWQRRDDRNGKEAPIQRDIFADTAATREMIRKLKEGP
jgi:hypothetical protein